MLKIVVVLAALCALAVAFKPCSIEAESDWGKKVVTDIMVAINKMEESHHMVMKLVELVDFSDDQEHCLVHLKATNQKSDVYSCTIHIDETKPDSHVYTMGASECHPWH